MQKSRYSFIIALILTFLSFAVESSPRGKNKQTKWELWKGEGDVEKFHLSFPGKVALDFGLFTRVSAQAMVLNYVPQKAFLNKLFVNGLELESYNSPKLFISERFYPQYASIFFPKLKQNEIARIIESDMKGEWKKLETGPIQDQEAFNKHFAPHESLSSNSSYANVRRYTKKGLIYLEAENVYEKQIIAYETMIISSKNIYQLISVSRDPKEHQRFVDSFDLL